MRNFNSASSPSPPPARSRQSGHAISGHARHRATHRPPPVRRPPFAGGARGERNVLRQRRLRHRDGVGRAQTRRRGRDRPPAVARRRGRVRARTQAAGLARKPGHQREHRRQCPLSPTRRASSARRAACRASRTWIAWSASVAGGLRGFAPSGGPSAAASTRAVVRTAASGASAPRVVRRWLGGAGRPAVSGGARPPIQSAGRRARNVSAGDSSSAISIACCAPTSVCPQRCPRNSVTAAARVTAVYAAWRAVSAGADTPSPPARSRASAHSAPVPSPASARNRHQAGEAPPLGASEEGDGDHACSEAGRAAGSASGTGSPAGQWAAASATARAARPARRPAGTASARIVRRRQPQSPWGRPARPRAGPAARPSSARTAAR